MENDSDYYPYGVERAYTTNLSNQNYKFTGKERDTESNLDNFGARYDASTLGRFMTPDWAARPIAVPYAVFGDPQSLNLYGYVRNDPVSTADLDGHSANDSQQCTMRPCGGFGFGSHEGRGTSLLDYFMGSIQGALAGNTALGDVLSNPLDSEDFSPFAFAKVAQNRGAPRPKPQQKLTFRTISGGAGSSSWVVQWRLSNKSKSGGWIIQHVTATTPFGMQIHHADYWEAWQVPAGSRITSYAVTGDINDDTFTATGGTRVRGEARFYEGLKLPSLFQPDNPATPAAGFLPATPVNPNLSTDNATEPVDRTWTAP